MLKRADGFLGLDENERMSRLQSGLTLSQESEKAACEVIQSLRGDQKVVWPQDLDGPDILVKDGPAGELIGIGEVKVAVDPQRQEFWDALDKRTVAGAVPLPRHFGTWSCVVSPEVRIDRLIPELPDLIRAMRDRHQDTATRIWNQQLNDLGITQLTYAGPSQDRCFLHMEMGDAALISPNEIKPWLEESLFGNPRYSNSWNRIQASDCAERHAFVWVMEGAPKAFHMYMMLHSDKPPTRPVALPYRITHLWLVTPSVFTDQNHGWLFSNKAWSKFLVK